MSRRDRSSERPRSTRIHGEWRKAGPSRLRGASHPAALASCPATRDPLAQSVEHLPLARFHARRCPSAPACRAPKYAPEQRTVRVPRLGSNTHVEISPENPARFTPGGCSSFGFGLCRRGLGMHRPPFAGGASEAARRTGAPVADCYKRMPCLCLWRGCGSRGTSGVRLLNVDLAVGQVSELTSQDLDSLSARPRGPSQPEG